MKILSIETSCDDTGISIIEAKGGIKNASFKILADNLSSQIKIHIPYGGVYPMLAKREHLKNLPILLEKTLRKANLTPTPLLDKERGLGRGKFTKSPVDAIAVTYGPGLEIALWTGITFAQELVKRWKVPLIPVNHMEGHIFSVFGKKKGEFKVPKMKTPILSLLVSGGHTELVLTKKGLDYKIIGETLDDAGGEAFDKVARMLGLPYPGGPQISKLAEREREHLAPLLNKEGVGGGNSKNHHLAFGTPPQQGGEEIHLPRPMLHSKNFDFSFAGLKTAVLYLIKKIGPLNEETKRKIALEFENAAIECLVYKTARAIETYKIKTLIIAGGVAANLHLRKEMSALGHTLGGKKIKIYFPQKELAMDNSLMIGIAGYLNYIKNKKKVPKLSSIKATGNLGF
jgi:N6-L-threonylcarbamoyladenine synthase